MLYEYVTFSIDQAQQREGGGIIPAKKRPFPPKPGISLRPGYEVNG